MSMDDDESIVRNSSSASSRSRPKTSAAASLMPHAVPSTVTSVAPGHPVCLVVGLGMVGHLLEYLLRQFDIQLPGHPRVISLSFFRWKSQYRQSSAVGNRFATRITSSCGSRPASV
jgi:hypothetical protein